MEGEVFLPLPAPRNKLAPTSQFRSTWIVSSQNALKQRGLFDRYLDLLPPNHRDTLAVAIVGGWMPIEVAVAHYRACEELALPAGDQLEIGRAVSRYLDNTLLSTAVRLARTSGATMWTPLSQLHRLWDRMFVGGGVCVYKVGPKEARIEFHECTLAPIGYFRTGLRGVLLGVGEHFSQRLYVNEIPRVSSGTSVVFRGSWV
jgi:hypothetical protein